MAAIDPAVRRVYRPLSGAVLLYPAELPASHVRRPFGQRRGALYGLLVHLQGGCTRSARGDPRQDEGNAYLRLGEVLTKLGREDEARDAYGTGVGQAGKFGHSGMAEDLRLARVQLGG